MTPEQIRYVQNSWGALAHQTDRVAQVFYQRLFQIEPELRDKFPPAMDEQCQAFLQMLNLVVNGLVCFDELVPEFEALGRRHLEYDVTEDQYDLVRAALLSMLEEMLGERFTPEARDAWAATYDRLAGVMKAAAYPRTMSGAL